MLIVENIQTLELFEVTMIPDLTYAMLPDWLFFCIIIIHLGFFFNSIFLYTVSFLEYISLQFEFNHT